MGAYPPKCLQCKRDLRYDLANLRYRCPACEAGEEQIASTAGAAGEASGPSGDVLRERAETFGRGAARLLHRVQRWLSR
jgi:hypothetical protein